MSENRSTTQPTGASIFSAAELKRRMAEREAAKTAEEVRHMQEQKEKQKAVMGEFHKPPERTADQLMQIVMGLVNTAAERGQSEVQVYRFPNALCSDGGRRRGRSALVSRLRCSSIREESRATSASFSHGSRRSPAQTHSSVSAPVPRCRSAAI